MRTNNDPRLVLWLGQLPAAALRIIEAEQDQLLDWEYVEPRTATLSTLQVAHHKLGKLWIGYGNHPAYGRCAEAFVDLIVELVGGRPSISDDDLGRHLANLNRHYDETIDEFFSNFADDETRVKPDRSALRAFHMASTYTGWMVDMVLDELPTPQVTTCPGTQIEHTDDSKECTLGARCRGDAILHPRTVFCQFRVCAVHRPAFSLAS